MARSKKGQVSYQNAISVKQFAANAHQSHEAVKWSQVAEDKLSKYITRYYVMTIDILRVKLLVGAPALLRALLLSSLQSTCSTISRNTITATSALEAPCDLRIEDSTGERTKK